MLLSLNRFHININGAIFKQCKLRNDNDSKWVVGVFEPEIVTRKFEFTIKIRDCRNTYIGICDGHQSNTDWIGSDTHAWSWVYDGRMYHNRKSEKNLEYTFKTGDKVGFVVDKNKGEICCKKNGKILGRVELFNGMILPEKLKICACIYYKKEELELVNVKDLDHEFLKPLPPMKFGGKVLKDEDKIKELIKEKTEPLFAIIKNQNEIINRLREESMGFKNLFAKWRENVKLNQINHELLKKKYNDHEDKFHITKYGIEKLETVPEMKTNENEDTFFCFIGKKFEFIITFETISSGSEMNYDAFDFSEIKIFINESEIKEIDRMPRVVEFEYMFKNIGKYEMIIEFQNIKKIYTINVSSSKISQDQTIMILRKSGTKAKEEEKKENIEKLNVRDEMEIYFHFKNLDGIGLPFEVIQDVSYSYKVVHTESKKVKARGFIDLEEENYEGDGRIVACSFSLKEGSNGGKYELSVADKDFSKVLYFTMLL